MVSHTRGSREFQVHAYLDSLPHRAVDMLAVRIEQLTAEGLSPSKICGRLEDLFRPPDAEDDGQTN
jgi:hypothetical protein